MTVAAVGEAPAGACSQVISLRDSLPPEGTGSQASLSLLLLGLLAESGGLEPFYFTLCDGE